MDVNQIKDHMTVIDSNSMEFATVDHLDAGSTIKLTKDDDDNHHWIPQAWVTRVDDSVHLDRPGDQAMQEWSTSNPAEL
ncbi:MAG: DUF2171 domain-containing protein [Chloroflexia bacterium]|nr:DUF2171 domain-containing protein [Chloroflexia bacterium]